MTNLITIRPNHKSPFSPSYPFKVMRRAPKAKTYSVAKCRACGFLVFKEYAHNNCGSCRTYEAWTFIDVSKETYETEVTMNMI